MNGRRKVVVDTNAFFIPEVFGVDIFSELERLGYTEILVPAEVLAELERLKRKRGLKGREKRALNVALALIQKYAAETEKAEEAEKVRERRDEADGGACGATAGGEMRRRIFNVRILRASGEREAEKTEQLSGEGGENRRKSTDEAIEEIALRERAAVLTLDEDLRRRLRKRGILTIHLRGGSRLEEAW